jgi:SSS family solute:Na+ symporter
VALALTAWAFKDAAGFAWLTFNISSITYGAMLGFFLRGIPATRCSDRGNLISMPQWQPDLHDTLNID